MRSIQFRPPIQNGAIARRPRRSLESTATRAVEAGLSFAPTGRAITVPRTRETPQIFPMGLLIICGVLIAACFVFGLYQHFTAGAIVKAETGLKKEMDDAKAEYENLKVRFSQAGNPEELEQRHAGSGLLPLRLEQAETPARPAKKQKGKKQRGI